MTKWQTLAIVCEGFGKAKARRKPLKPETAEQIIAATEQMYEMLGLSFKNGVKEQIQWLKKSLTALTRVRNRQGFEVELRKSPEPTLVQLNALLETIRLMPYVYRKAMLDTVKKLPHNPGGRKRLIESNEFAAICAEISAQHLQNTVPLGEIISQIARRKNVSSRAIQRIWDNRKAPQPTFAEATEP